MKIAFNSSPLKTGHKNRGIGYYTKNLLEGLKKDTSIDVQEFDNLTEVKTADLIHYPFFDLFDFTLPLNKKFPTVVTIHDVIPLVFPTHYPPGIKGQINLLMQKLSIQSVKAVITDSESSKKDIVKYLGVDEKKIFSIYLAAEKNFHVISEQKKLTEVKEKYNLNEPFFIYTGNVNWNKNIVKLAQACVELNVHLVMVGGGFDKQTDLNHPELASYREFLEKYSQNPLVHVLGFVEMEDLIGLLNISSGLLLPSYYEGFGLTILEAQSCGTPVVTSNLSSMVEVGGDAVLYVDPYNLADIKNKIKQISEDKTLRNLLVKKGLENIKRFSWEKTVFQTVEVYKKVIENSHV